MILNLNSVNSKRGKFEGRDGLKTAFVIMKEFYKKYQRLPLNREPEILGICSALYRGEWREFGYWSWNDLLIEVFGEINVRMNVYIKEEGLNKAIKALKDLYHKNGIIPVASLPEVKKLLKEFEEYNDRLPTINDTGMGKIATAVYRGRFMQYNISSWNELLLHVFDEINFVGKNAYFGKKGLELAKHKLTTFLSNKDYQPSPSSKGMSGLSQAIKNGNLSEFNINTWNDLLFFVFGKVERRRKNPDSQFLAKSNDPDALLQLIKKELIEFKDISGRIPRTRDKSMSSIINQVRKGHLRKYGVNKWNDLLNLVFGEVNQRQNIYTGKQGLQRAINELKEFHKKYKRLPTTYNKGMGGILRAIKRGEWKNWGIIRWNDLLIEAFGQVNLRRRKRTF